MANLTRGAGAIDGVLPDLAALQATKPSLNTRLELITGERYKVDAVDGGSGVLLANGAYANPVIAGSTTIDVNSTLLVPAEYSTPLDAMEFLMDFTIGSGVEVTILVSAGSYVHANSLPNHNQSAQIKIEGASLLSSFPVESDFIITGNDSPSRAVDNANHLSMLKSKYAVDIYCGTDSFIESTKGYNAPEIENLLIWTDTGSVVGYRLYSGIGYFSNCSFHGFGSTNVVVVNSGNFRGTGITSSGSSQYGFQSSDVSDIKITESVGACSNSSGGFFLKRNGCAEYVGAFSNGNGGNGFDVADSGVMDCPESSATNNGTNGYRVSLGGDMNCVNAVSSNNEDFGFVIVSSGNMIANGATAELNTLSGFSCDGNATMTCESSFSNFNGGSGYKSGENADMNATLSSADSNASHNYYATAGGRIYALNAVSDNAGGSGVRADGVGSKIVFQGGTSINSSVHGLYALFGAEIRADGGATIGSSGNPNAGSGALVQEQGLITVQGSSIEFNLQRGVYVLSGGFIDAENATIANNTGNEVQVVSFGKIRIEGAGVASVDIDGWENQTTNIVETKQRGINNVSEAVKQTIASGVISVSSSMSSIETEGLSATDDLDTINGTQVGDVIYLRSHNSSRDTTVKHGTGNIFLNGGADRVLSTTRSSLVLINWNGTELIEMNGSNV
jgi:hypothetical protein